MSGPWNKELVRLAEGLSLIAKETLKRSQTLKVTHSDLPSLISLSLKKSILPATDLLGLTSGKITEIPTKDFHQNDTILGKNGEYEKIGEIPTKDFHHNHTSLEKFEEYEKIGEIPTKDFHHNRANSEKFEEYEKIGKIPTKDFHHNRANSEKFEEYERIGEIPTKNFSYNRADSEKSGVLSSALEKEKLIQENQTNLEKFGEKGKIIENTVEPGQSAFDASLSDSAGLSSFDGERSRVENDRVNVSNGAVEIGVTKIGLDSLGSSRENLGNNVVKNDVKKEHVGAGLAPPKKQRRPRERRVPSTPFSRALGFAGLGAGLAWGTFQESTKRLVFGTNSQDKQSAYSPFLSEKNAERLALALCRMRGAALKIGQMLSIQDESLIPPPILAALDIVRQGADVMPKSQLDQVLDAELGPNWSSKLINFDYAPLASASIGQVHKAVTEDGVDVAVKIQYPGVADSIESDIENVKLLLNYTNLIPKGLFLDSAIKVAKQELSRECDYELEAANQKRFRDFLFQTKGFYVPMVMNNISSKRVITTELVSGIPIDKVASLSQETRNYVGRKMLELTLMELFVFRFMQTDPNWSNFLFDEATNTINLIDFGAARDFPKGFVDNYLRMVMACANSEREPVLEMSTRLGFLTGMESEILLDAHVQAAFVVGLPFSKPGLYDFRAANITQSISNLGATMLRHRLTPPPDEAYSLHRKLSGAFLACIKIGAVVPCRDLLLEIYKGYKFGEEGDSVLSSGSVS